jgi:molybdenum cofactor cytidylyltransferase
MPSAERPRVAAVVLAAGSSTRMGRNKMLLDLGGRTVVRRAVQATIDAGVDSVVVVLGHEAERVEAELSGLPCTRVLNPDHAQGVGTSLHRGIAHAADGADAIVVILADMPFVSADMIATVVERYRESGAPLVVSRYGEVQAPPTLYDRALFAELLAVPDGGSPNTGCGKQVVRRHLHEAATVAWPEDALRDIDVAEDYERVRAQLAGA